MQILRAANYKVMPWKNGMGATTEIAISPDDATVDDFDWRVSMAQVSIDGAFSSFPGIDRTLLVLEGEGVTLNVGDRTLHFDRQSIHPFPGDQPTSATLTNGPIVDLNIMSRRGVVQHAVKRIKVLSPQVFSASKYTLLFIESGAITVRSDATTEILAERDTLLIDAHMSAVTIESAAPAGLISITLW
jgi:environmental stress-induced protein Ves